MTKILIIGKKSYIGSNLYKYFRYKTNHFVNVIVLYVSYVLADVPTTAGKVPQPVNNIITAPIITPLIKVYHNRP